MRKSRLMIIMIAAFIVTVLGIVSYRQSSMDSLPYIRNTDIGKDGSDIEQPRSKMPAITLLFGGDMMFDRWIREKTMKRGNSFVFDGVRDELKTHDLVVANLEGPITDMRSKSMLSTIGSRDNYIFTFDPSWATTLAKEGIGPVNLGNNHILNQETEGAIRTKAYLDEVGVASFGDPTSENRISIQDIRGTKVSFVSYDEFTSDGKRHAFDDIAKAKATSDIVILYAHWGAEYLPVRENVRQLAHAFVDAGADAVIGSHPHVVQDSETYAGKTIYYSLGNFVFDQYQRDDTKHGLLVSMTIDPSAKAILFRDIPIELHTDGSTSVYHSTSDK
jgi:hypothetical protein